MDRLKLFGLLIKLVWMVADWLSKLKKANSVEPTETGLSGADAAPPPRLKRRKYNPDTNEWEPLP